MRIDGVMCVDVAAYVVPAVVAVRTLVMPDGCQTPVTVQAKCPMTAAGSQKISMGYLAFTGRLPRLLYSYCNKKRQSLPTDDSDAPSSALALPAPIRPTQTPTMSAQVFSWLRANEKDGKCGSV